MKEYIKNVFNEDGKESFTRFQSAVIMVVAILFLAIYTYLYYKKPEIGIKGFWIAVTLFGLATGGKVGQKIIEKRR